MILCLTCGRIWPSGSKFCGQCGKSFGARLCPKGHRNPAQSTLCTDCSSKELSKPGLYLNLKLVSIGLAFGVLILISRLIVRNASGIAACAFQLLDQIFRFVAGIGISELAAGIFNLLLALALPFVLGWIFFERGKRPSAWLGAYWRLVCAGARVALTCFRLLGRLLFARPRDKAKTKRKEP